MFQYWIRTFSFLSSISADCDDGPWIFTVGHQLSRGADPRSFDHTPIRQVFTTQTNLEVLIHKTNSGWGRLWYRRKHVAFEKFPKIHQHV